MFIEFFHTSHPKKKIVEYLKWVWLGFLSGSGLFPVIDESSLTVYLLEVGFDLMNLKVTSNLLLDD